MLVACLYIAVKQIGVFHRGQILLHQPITFCILVMQPHFVYLSTSGYLNVVIHEFYETETEAWAS